MRAPALMEIVPALAPPGSSTSSDFTPSWVRSRANSGAASARAASYSEVTRSARILSAATRAAAVSSGMVSSPRVRCFGVGVLGGRGLLGGLGGDLGEAGVQRLADLVGLAGGQPFGFLVGHARPQPVERVGGGGVGHPPQQRFGERGV